MKMVKNGHNDHVTEAKVSLKNLDFGGHQVFWPLLHTSLAILSPKTMPKQLLNNSNSWTSNYDPIRNTSLTINYSGFSS